jgi:hypothetical protein
MPSRAPRRGGSFGWPVENVETVEKHNILCFESHGIQIYGGIQGRGEIFRKSFSGKKNRDSRAVAGTYKPL